MSVPSPIVHTQIGLPPAPPDLIESRTFRLRFALGIFLTMTGIVIPLFSMPLVLSRRALDDTPSLVPRSTMRIVFGWQAAVGCC